MSIINNNSTLIINLPSRFISQTIESEYFVYADYSDYPVYTRHSLREKCTYSEFLWSVFSRPHSDVIQRDTDYLSVFSPNAGKYGPEKLRVWTQFTQ